MRYDKKVQEGKLRLVLLRSIGDAYLTADFSSDHLTRVLKEIPHND
jgi:3-dehydroquinate synthase